MYNKYIRYIRKYRLKEGGNLKRKVYKNGNSLVVGLTEVAKEFLGIKVGDCLDMKVNPKTKQIIIEKMKKGDK
jgi:hypothetical protein